MGDSQEITKYIFFFQAEDGIRDLTVTGVQTCALPILLDVSQQVDCRTHLFANETLRLIADALAEHLLVLLTHAQSRAAIISEVDDVILIVFIELFDVDLGTDQNRLFRRITTSWIWIERANKLQLFEQRFNVDADLFREMRQFMLLQISKVFADQFRGETVAFTQNFQLDQQTF